MREWVIYILAYSFAALGTGQLEYFHNLVHEMEDDWICQMASRGHHSAGDNGGQRPVHDDSNCPVHAQLHIPLLTAGWVPLLVWLGVFVAFLSQIAPRWTPVRWCLKIYCRGPPAC